jgi:hypothetical protein
MIDPSELVDNLVAALRDIPDLVAEMGSDADRIYAYHDQYPQRVSLAHAIHQMPVPGLMAVWQGTQPGSFSGVDVWKHQLTLFVRVGASAVKEGVAVPTTYYSLFRLIVKGTPSTGDQPILNTAIHDSCYPMDLPMIQRQTDSEGLDYFEIPIQFTEIGDE